MTIATDLTQWRVYSAEQSLPAGQEFESAEEAQTYLWWVQSTAWWKTTFPDAPKITFESGGDRDPMNLVSFAQHHDAMNSTVSLHPRMMNAVVLLHEVAHCLAPRSFGDIRAIRRGKLVRYPHHHHGPYFRATFCALAERYKIGVDTQELRRAYDHFELDTPDLEALIEARAHSVEVDRVEAEMWEDAHREFESSERFAAIRERTEQLDAEEDEDRAQNMRDLETWRPAWGRWIWHARRFRKPLMSQPALAEAVSPVVACSALDVRRLERSDNRPTDPLDLNRCLAFTAVLGQDPVWAETAYGIAPGELTITLDQLEAVAPEWVSLVRHLNALLEARPPRWQGVGDR